MINVTIKRNNNIIVNLSINGHAEYNDYGKDIVCASVSTMLIVTVNAILEFDKNSIKYNEGNDFTLENLKKDEITNKLLNNLYNHLKELSIKYKNNIKIKEE